MLKSIAFVLCLLLLCATVEAVQYPPLTADQSTAFFQQMQSALGAAEKKVKELEAFVERKDIMPTWNNKLELQNAIVQLEVKKTLVNNFKNTESLRSDLVKRKLLEVLNKSIITTGDLADLQNLVLQEKANIRAQDAASGNKPAAVPETAPADTGPAFMNEREGP